MHKVQLVRDPVPYPWTADPSLRVEHSAYIEDIGRTGDGSGIGVPRADNLRQIEQKKMEYERIRQQRQRFELEMQKLDQQQRREAQELAQMEEEMGRVGGHQSEPTTPPEYRDNPSGFPSIFSRPNRYSTSSLTSPQGGFNRSSRSGSQLASPQSGLVGSQFPFQEQPQAQAQTQMPSRSVPGTRRNSDDEEKNLTAMQNQTSQRSANAFNRYSMPATRTKSGYDPANTAGFLFGDDEPNTWNGRNTPDEHFPTLVRRDDQILSASSAALDLALSSSPAPDAQPTVSQGWRSGINRHRAQQSLSAISGPTSGQNGTDVLGLGNRTSVRRSVDFSYMAENPEGSSNIMASQHSSAMATPPKLHNSYSSNEVPTLKSTSGMNNANHHAQQHFHNHNASMGRIPAGAVPTRHSRELSNDSNLSANRDTSGGYPSIQSALQASAAPFGPATAAPAPLNPVASPTGSNGNFSNPYYPNNGGYGMPNGMNGGNLPSGPNGIQSYGMPMLTQGLQQMGLNGGSNVGMYPAQNYNNYGSMPYNQGNAPRDSQTRVIQHRRQLDNEAMARYQNMPLESFQGQIYDLCKDQHGCRYLQRKLEERNADQVHLIWLETNQHVIELMTDPFGNYLCQKLLEYCNDDERTVLIQNASQDMVRIALNQHGTRALQKMIEFVSTPQQVHLIIEALRFRVVDLIQDLNGNHVIQKCLNKLVAADSQFIFDAVGNNCVEVGTHRHGCCVLQRCIDHATGEQKLWMIQRITENARILVQDPFGNYVVQYIIDLNEPTFTEPVVAMFRGCISQLSRHKFSSNVIEKCLRCAQPPSKDMIVEEMLNPQEMERLLRDNFANYVIQTALEYSTPSTKNRLVEAIRPLLPQIRNTPYGRRIQAKVSAYDNRGSAASSGQATPADNTQGQIPLRPSNARGPPMAPTNGLTNGHAMPAMGGSHQNMAPYPNSNIMTVTPPNGTNGVTQQQNLGQRMPVPFQPGTSSTGANASETSDAPWV